MSRRLCTNWELPLVPSDNAYYGKRAVNGRVINYLSKDARDFREIVGELVKMMGYDFRSEKPIKARVVVCPKINRGDVMNRNKGLWDALEAAKVFMDDKQIFDCRFIRGPKVKGGAMYLTLTECDEEC